MPTQSKQIGVKTAAVDGDEEPKIFICYAGDNRDLLRDFIEKFRHHYGKMELLFDGTPHSGSLHERFKGFAEECKIAILLVNAKFTNFQSYANKHEIPVLLKRQKKYEVTVIGALFSDVDVLEWNEKGDIYFFHLLNNDLVRTRRKDENADYFNNRFAVYEVIEKEDRHTYHKELVAWVKEAVGKTAVARSMLVKSSPKSPASDAKEVTSDKTPYPKGSRRPPPQPEQYLPRSTEQTEEILKKIHDPFLRALEEKLSMSNYYWFGHELNEQEKKALLLPIFFERQHKRIKAARERLGDLDQEADAMLRVRLKNLIPEVEDVKGDLKDLLSMVETKDQEFEEIFENIECQLVDIRRSIKLIHRNDVRENLRNDFVPDLFENLSQLDKKMNVLDKNINEYMRN
jgi:hypothetical protein